jgi:hypothetical protein
MSISRDFGDEGCLLFEFLSGQEIVLSLDLDNLGLNMNIGSVRARVGPPV